MSSRNKSPAISSGESHSQRLFTEEDESNLLNSYFQISTSTNNSHPTLDSQTLDLIETTLSLKFRPTQIVDKLRRLRLKYHNLARTKSLIKTPHDLLIYQIGRNVWGKPFSPRKRVRTPVSTNKNQIAQTLEPDVSVTRNEETDLRNFPVLVSEFSQRFPGNVVWVEGMKSMEEKSLVGMNKDWILLHIEEAELQARRAALVQRQLRSCAGGICFF